MFPPSEPLSPRNHRYQLCRLPPLSPIHKIPGDCGFPLIGPNKTISTTRAVTSSASPASKSTSQLSSVPTCHLAPSSPPTQMLSFSSTWKPSPSSSTTPRSTKKMFSLAPVRIFNKPYKIPNEHHNTLRPIIKRFYRILGSIKLD